MNPTITGLLRHVLTTAGGILVTKGYTDSAGLETIIGVAIALIGAGWSALHKKQVAGQIAVALATPVPEK